MGRYKNNFTSTINFGNKGEPARILLKEYIKRHPKYSISKLVRNLIVAYLSKNGDKQFQIKVLKEEYKVLSLTIGQDIKKRTKIGYELTKLGVNLEKEI